MEYRIEYNKGKLFCKKEGTDPLLLLIHGIMSDSSSFSTVVSQLSEYFTVVTYDRRGYSKSRELEIESRTQFTMKSQAQDAARVIKSAKQGAALVIGCGIGGNIALELAQQMPELVSGLLLYEPLFVTNDQAGQTVLRWRDQMEMAAQNQSVSMAQRLFLDAMGGKDIQRYQKKSIISVVQDLENMKVFLHKEQEHFWQMNTKLQETLMMVTRRTACVLAVGECDTGGVFAQATIAMAKRMNYPLLYAYGYHNLPEERPQEFALLIYRVWKNLETTLAVGMVSNYY